LLDHVSLLPINSTHASVVAFSSQGYWRRFTSTADEQDHKELSVSLSKKSFVQKVAATHFPSELKSRREQIRLGQNGSSWV